MIRLGLCCKFMEAPIHFRTATATALLRLRPRARRARLSEICLHNANALRDALEFCNAHGIGSFRVNSQILPVKTHPRAGFDIEDLSGADAIVRTFRSCGRYARKHGLRTLFHPDQFIVLSSVDPDLTRRSVAELEYQAEVAGWIGADVINLHGGGAYGDKPSALARVRDNIRRLPPAVRRRLTLENDDRVYTPRDLLPVCEATGVPLTYDAHHHRCLPDGLTVAEATRAALGTWRREPAFHISSPRDGWRSANPRPHHDYISPRDFPREWQDLDLTVEVEAKAKELAVLRLRRLLVRRGAIPAFS